MARERLNVSKAEDAVKNAMKKIKGAYALVISSPRKMIGARDPFGLKPLCIGKRDNTYFLASESCAIAAVGAEFVRDVLPGEIVSITKHGMSSDMSMALPEEKRARCILNIFTLQEQTVRSMESESIIPELLLEKHWHSLIR